MLDKWIKTISLYENEDTCPKGKAASNTYIAANGGKFEKEIFVDGDRIKRYWIQL